MTPLPGHGTPCRGGSRRVLRGLAALGLALASVAGAGVTAASAATFSVNPTQIFLSGRSASTLLTLRNDSTETLRFEVSAFGWDQGPTGEIQLTPTHDVVFFPALLSLEPNEERKIRVGSIGGAAAYEQTYRIFVEELPPPAGEGDQTAVRVLTKMGIPIFVRPGREQASASLHGLAAGGGAFQFEMTNSGTVHFVPQQLKVRGLATSGDPVFEEDVSAWYILAGGRRIFDLSLPQDACARIASLVVEFGLGSSVLAETLETPGGVCGSS